MVFIHIYIAINILILRAFRQDRVRKLKRSHLRDVYYVYVCFCVQWQKNKLSTTNKIIAKKLNVTFFK